LDGVALGDVWACDTLDVGSDSERQRADTLVPFHKLSQWLAWSLLEVVVKLGKLKVSGTEKLTGLPEYRNGGLLVDMGVLTLTPADLARGLRDGSNVPVFEGGDAVIVEWRAMTVALLDKIADRIKAKCGLPSDQLPDMFLARVLEGGTWKAGRELAARMRPTTKDPPIDIISDGTLF
ncbi:hypothetical protein LPJ58_004649, partial [Coemansia sp. RSA 1591]